MKHSKQLPLDLVSEQPQDFTHFVCNGEGAAAVSALKSRLPDFSYLWGVQATGKTHLLNACRDWHERQMVNAMMLDARQMLSIAIEQVLPVDLQLLLVDDIDVLSGSRDTETLAFNLFNHCKASGVSLIFSAAVSPRSDDWVLPDLRSRLNSGQVLPLALLSGEQALILFEKQLNVQGISYDQSVMSYVEKHLPSDYQSLSQLLQSVAIATLKAKHKLTVPLLKKINPSSL